MTMPDRLLRLLAFAMIALLPLQASYASVSCAPMEMEMKTCPAPSECDDCRKDVADSCRSFCGTLCQSPVEARLLNFGTPGLSANLHFQFFSHILVLGLGGPEPPPPRLGD
jgi:hypothetical protein